MKYETSSREKPSRPTSSRKKPSRPKDAPGESSKVNVADEHDGYRGPLALSNLEAMRNKETVVTKLTTRRRRRDMKKKEEYR